MGKGKAANENAGRASQKAVGMLKKQSAKRNENAGRASQKAVGMLKKQSAKKTATSSTRRGYNARTGRGMK